MREGSARLVGVPAAAPREVFVIPLRAVRYRESPWDRLRRHVRTLASRESVSEAVLVTITLALIGALSPVSTMQSSLRHRRPDLPPVSSFRRDWVGPCAASASS